MSDIWFTSDLHLGHKNIINFDRRPFFNIEEHDEAIITYFNELVKPDDLLFLLGDICMGFLPDSLANAKKLNGHKYLISGNHDRTSRIHSEEYRGKFWGMYEDVFKILPDNMEMLVNGNKTNFSHYPYATDHLDEPRYMKYRMVDDGTPLVHGHLHATETISYSPKGTLQVHVGVTSHKWRPVHVDTLIELLKDN